MMIIKMMCLVTATGTATTAVAEVTPQQLLTPNIRLTECLCLCARTRCV